ncbi:MAG: hypothetical protein MR902_07210 [Campylobacter sp.]|nr:hypothetical protein [Campylobacter sp.]
MPNINNKDSNKIFIIKKADEQNNPIDKELTINETSDKATEISRGSNGYITAIKNNGQDTIIKLDDGRLVARATTKVISETSVDEIVEYEKTCQRQKAIYTLKFQ